MHKSGARPRGSVTKGLQQPAGVGKPARKRPLSFLPILLRLLRDRRRVTGSFVVMNDTKIYYVMRGRRKEYGHDVMGNRL